MVHLDVLVVGAGLSGIAAAWYLKNRCPDRSFAILEARDTLGGTWDLFRYPGIRSDSDMYTLGFSFRPWRDPQAIADGPAILAYLRETADEIGVAIRYRHRVERVRWSSADNRWTVTVRRTDTGEAVTLTCGFLWGCTGYYRYDRGYTPDLPGVERFRGRLVHPQQWPEDLDWAGKRVLVIGSGATAMTLVPALSERAAHVTMLQRSPTYVVTSPRVDVNAERLKRSLSPRVAHRLSRWKNILYSVATYQLSRRRPEVVRQRLLDEVRASLPPGFDVERHFTPSYDPWDQRICLLPDGDLFAAIRTGRVSVVTDTIETFTERGVRVRSGDELEADVIVTATGLELQFLGGAEIGVDGRPVVMRDTMMYRGVMLSDVPNAACSIGYINASWTLKCELSSEYVCRVLEHMRRHGHTRCVPRRDPDQPATPAMGDLDAGYVRRAADRMPTQGRRTPWRVHQNYLMDLWTLRRARVDDGVLELT